MTYDVGVMGNGALAGLVAITSGCSTIYPWGSVIVGFIAGILYVAGSMVSVMLKVRQPPDFIHSHECSIVESGSGFSCAACTHWDTLVPCCQEAHILTALGREAAACKYGRLHTDWLAPPCSWTTLWTPLPCTPGTARGA